eukprot:TRINITY_DN3945_c0_g1_i5.p1 TRINITY_DN3945_c0_g1~~TRINITY_DN3945_c0_g1_i5.p1  ORF type:complete len:169 (-),score=41.81 TRINITY_DN3945_c0_g1_i5:38-544(-)
MQKIKADAKKNGFVSTPEGTRRQLRDINSSDGKARSRCERQAVNSVIQGTAAEIIKRAMLKLDSLASGCDAHLVLQLHDELLIELPQERCAEGQQLLRACMEHPNEDLNMHIPLVVNMSVGTQWGSLQPVKGGDAGAATADDVDDMFDLRFGADIDADHDGGYDSPHD